jgi:hypothetical protein
MRMPPAVVWNDLQKASQIGDVRRVEPAFHIHQARVGDSIEISSELFALGLVLDVGEGLVSRRARVQHRKGPPQAAFPGDLPGVDLEFLGHRKHFHPVLAAPAQESAQPHQADILGNVRRLEHFCQLRGRAGVFLDHPNDFPAEGFAFPVQHRPAPQFLDIFRHALRNRRIVAGASGDVQRSPLARRGVAVIDPYIRILEVRLNEVLGQQRFSGPAFPDHGLADRRARRKSRQGQTDERPGNRGV